MADAQVAHFVLPLTHKPTPKAKQKEPLLPKFYKNAKMKLILKQ